MKELDEQGIFWLPDDPEDHLSGRLHFHPRDGIQVSLVGNFRHHSAEGKSLFRILGVIGAQRVTLERCFLLHRKYASPGIGYDQYCANQMFLGYHAESESVEFNFASAQFGELARWVGMKGIQEKWSENSESSSDSCVLTFSPRVHSTHEFSRGKISIRRERRRENGNASRAAFIELPVIAIEYHSVEPFKQIQQDISQIQDFITLCTDSNSVVLDQLILHHPDVHELVLSGAESGFLQMIEFRAPYVKYTKPEDRKELQPYQMLITFDEVGGLSAIGRWLDLVPRYRRALNSLMSVKHAERMYAENRFLNIVYAAESFHRVSQGGTYLPDSEFLGLYLNYMRNTPKEHRKWLRDKLGHGNDAPLVKRLRQLARQSWAATSGLIGKKDRWAYVVSSVRNELTHLANNNREFSGGDLNELAESVYSVVRACLLLECGLDPVKLSRMRDSDAMTWRRGRLQLAIGNVSNTLRS